MKNILNAGIIAMLTITTSCEKEEILTTSEVEVEVSQDQILEDSNDSNQVTSDLSSKQFFNQLILKSIRLKKDHEPRVRGGAEIYGVLIAFEEYFGNGVPSFRFINMDYLDHDKKTYRRDDLIYSWTTRARHVGLVIMEYDGNIPVFFKPGFNFQDLYKPLEFFRKDEKESLKILTQRVARKLEKHDDYVDQFYYFPNNEAVIEYTGREKNARVRLINRN